MDTMGGGGLPRGKWSRSKKEVELLVGVYVDDMIVAGEPRLCESPSGGLGQVYSYGELRSDVLLHPAIVTVLFSRNIYSIVSRQTCSRSIGRR